MEDLYFNIQEVPIKEGPYSISKYLCESIKRTTKNVMISEGIEYEFESPKKGGIILFSQEVNAIELDNNKLKNWIKKKVATLNNKLFLHKKVDDVANKYDLVGWTIGKYLSGRYKAKNGKIFGEDSISVEIIGIDLDTLLEIAKELCVEFIQESVLVKDYNDNKIYLVNAE